MRRKQASEVRGKSGNPNEERVSRKRIPSTVSNVAEGLRKVETKNWSEGLISSSLLTGDLDENFSE